MLVLHQVLSPVHEFSCEVSLLLSATLKPKQSSKLKWMQVTSLNTLDRGKMKFVPCALQPNASFVHQPFFALLLPSHSVNNKMKNRFNPS
jgi:hypothetical protein